MVSSDEHLDWFYDRSFKINKRPSEGLENWFLVLVERKIADGVDTDTARRFALREIWGR